jgi:hypothetical protein
MTRNNSADKQPNESNTENPKGHYSVHISPTLASITSHLNAIHILTFYCFLITFNIILPSTPRSSKCHPSFRFSHQISPCMASLYVLSVSSSSILEQNSLWSWGKLTQLCETVHRLTHRRYVVHSLPCLQFLPNYYTSHWVVFSISLLFPFF